MSWDLAATHLPWPVLSIVTPFAAALLSALLGRRGPLIHLGAVPAVLAFAAFTVLQVRAHGPQTYALGGWSAPLGIELRIDGLAAAFLCLAALVCAAVAAYAARFFPQARGETRAGFTFHPLFLLLWGGLNAIFLAGDLFNLYVALELVTLCAVALVALDGRRAALAAALRYMLFALFGSLAFLAGAALVYGAYGTLDMRLVADAVRPDMATRAAAALMTAGLLAKMALFPLHAWLPPAHARAPAPASALLSALVVKAAFYVLLRLWFDVLEPVATGALGDMLGLLGAAAVAYGSLSALRQRRLKQIVAYSTVAQLGLMCLAFPLAAATTAAAAWSGAVFLSLAHGLAKSAMFLAAGAILVGVGSDNLDAIRGVARRMPVAAFAFGIAAVSLMGLPPSGGFLAKYLLLTAAAGAGAWGWAVVPLAAGLLSAAYLFRPLGRMLEDEQAGPPEPAAAPMVLQGAALALAFGAILLGALSLEPSRLILIGGGWESPP